MASEITERRYMEMKEECERLRAALQSIVNFEGEANDMASNAECRIRDIAQEALKK